MFGFGLKKTVSEKDQSETGTKTNSCFYKLQAFNFKKLFKAVLLEVKLGFFFILWQHEFLSFCDAGKTSSGTFKQI